MKLSILAEKQINGSMIAVEHDLRDQISELVHTKSQTEAARELMTSTGYFNDVLHGRRSISGRLAQKLGWKRMAVFVRQGGGSC
jgi:hypothetical protein